MKVKVLMAFTDKLDIRIIHEVNEIMEMDEERASKAISRGIVEEVSEKPIKTAEKVAKKPTKSKE